MTKADFWQLIGDDGNADAVYNKLMHNLVKLPEIDIIRFGQYITHYKQLATTSGVLTLANKINGNCEEHDLPDFIGWLIAQGETVYTTAVKQPTDMVALDAEYGEAWCEDILHVASNAFFDKRGIDYDYCLYLAACDASPLSAQDLE